VFRSGREWRTGPKLRPQRAARTSGGRNAFRRPEQVLTYLSRYTHRVAISNSRLIAADATGVTFRFKDYRIKGPGRYKTIKWQAVVPRALWGFARGRRTGCWQPTPMSALVDDVAAHERGAASVSVRLEQ